MTDEYQVEIPQSFMALFVDSGRQKPNANRAVVSDRYELCEDMASMLTETAKNMLFSLSITDRDVLERVYRGLVGEGAVVTQPQAVWVVHRLAELLARPV
jgi:protein gp37